MEDLRNVEEAGTLVRPGEDKVRVDRTRVWPCGMGEVGEFCIYLEDGTDRIS